ncbi:C-X-C motif chemokine 6-like [Suncus etruscus]|uniref:C-X-C motif chemokine 6-like n=1 Tax=Suncus etruscus TaxID=109475 RepID=UPI00210FDFE1|nr:C-X-C motif chemokine 6-like [Suncus etruscus]
MSRLPLQGARFPWPPRSLCALLALLLVAQQGPLASAGPVAAVVRELRCICLTVTQSSFHSSLISTLQLIFPGPHCSRLEILATLKGRTEPVCLDPQTPWIKGFIYSKLNNNNQKSMKNKNRTLRRLSSSEPVSVRSQ